MPAASRKSIVSIRRLYWVGPATVVLATSGVAIARRLLVPLVGTPPDALRFPLLSSEPLVVTGLLATGAVIVFAIAGDVSLDPLRLFRRIAAGVLAVSFVPNLIAATSRGGRAWKAAAALGVLHVVAWAIVVAMLTRLATRQEGPNA